MDVCMYEGLCIHNAVFCEVLGLLLCPKRGQDKFKPVVSAIHHMALADLVLPLSSQTTYKP